MLRHVGWGLSVLSLAASASAQDAWPSPQPPAAPAVAPIAAETVPATATPATAAPAKRNEENGLQSVLSQRDARGRSCELRAIADSGPLRYLACGDAGVWIVRVAHGAPPVIVEQHATSGSASGFFMRDGTLWVETTTIQAERLAAVETGATVRAEPLRGSPTTAAPFGAAPPPSAAPRVRSVEPRDYYEPEPAQVVALEPGYAVIDMGTVHGVQSGDRVAFEDLELDRVDFEPSQRNRRVAVGQATSVARTRTRVALGLGERVRLGMSARPTRDPLTATAFLPPRLGGLWHAGFVARPFLVVDDVGIGVAVEARAGYRWDFPVHVEALIKPLAFGTGRAGLIAPAAGIVSGSFDSKLFEVGLGVGGQTVHDPEYDLDSGSGTTLAQRVRIGAVDGTMLEVFSYIVLFHSEFEFSDLHLHGQIRVGEHSWLIANASGGALGFGFADVGLRVMVAGNGDRGTISLSATVGGVHMFETEYDEVSETYYGTADYTGPMIGVGAEWRL